MDMNRLKSVIASRLARVLLCSLLVLPALHAQLGSRWKSTYAHDFADLYQQPNAKVKIKPEILTLFDFSGSMGRIMFHDAFPNDINQEEGTKINGAYDATVAPHGKSYYAVRITQAGSSGARSVALSFVESDLSSGQPTGRTPGLTGYTISGTQLIRPNGDVVTQALVNSTVTDATLPGSGAVPKADDVRNWLRAASHARMTFTGGLLGATTRTIDLPLNWCVIDPSTTVNTATTVPLKSLKVVDPKVPANKYEIDSTYLDEDGSGNVQFIKKPTNSYSTVIDVSFASGVWRWDYIVWILTNQVGGVYLIPNAVANTAPANNGLPTRCRLQAIKEAAIRTWFQFQDDVFWAYRGLDSTYPDTIDASVTVIDTTTTGSVPLAATGGNTRDWVLMSAANNHGGARRLAKLTNSGGTPLTKAYGDALAQMQSNAPWATLESTTVADNRVRDCTKHFVILFTDGTPINDGTVNEFTVPAVPTTNQPYWFNAQAGNDAVKAAKSQMDAHGNYWNLPTLAGAAAHGSDLNLGVIATPANNSSLGASAVSRYLPFGITYRSCATPTTTLSPAQPIQTMAVGVSLAWNLTNAADAANPKKRLLGMATFGDPRRVSGYPTPLNAEDYDVNNTTSTRDPNEVWYFDGRTPDAIVQGMSAAFKFASGKSSTNITSTPSIPLVGVGLGHQIYLGRFDPFKNGGPAWSGDLVMFPTKEDAGQTKILTITGAEITDDLSTATPGWSAAAAIRTKGWASRTLYTRLPATSGVWNPVIQKISDTGADWDAIKASIPGYTITDSGAKALKRLRWLMGADTSSTASPLPTRGVAEIAAGKTRKEFIDVMGDVMDSSPTAIEYNLTSTIKGLLPGTLSPYADKTGAHFRVIFVGTNQGHLHAFGEISWEENLATGNAAPNYLTKAVVEELWSFIPTEVLTHMDYFESPDNVHSDAVNGVPVIYHLDIAASDALRANGMVDYNATELATQPNERALVLFGLGKGGRSYYALDIHNPFLPTLGGTGSIGWTLAPDEAYSYPTTRFTSATVSPNVTNMGLSTCVPAVGRVLYKDKMRDVVFVGGGFSCFDIEKDFPSAGTTTKLGRSVIAIEAATGTILNTWSLPASAGPASVGVVPFRFFLNTGLTQRLYFTDFFGSLWAINGSGLGTGDYDKFRVDTSTMDDWITSPRKVYSNSGSNAITTTLPAPFKVGNYYPRAVSPLVNPGTVGIAMVSGNRNDPLDQGYAVATTAFPTPPSPYDVEPTQHRVTVVFDRQDSLKEGLDAAGIVDAKLTNMSSQNTVGADVINSSNAAFYLKDSSTPGAAKYGWYINFPAKGTTSFVSKGIVPPSVLSGVLFYSYFTPESIDVCTGGTGKSYTRRTCDIMRPVNASTTAVDGCTSGQLAIWFGVASNIAAKSIVAVIQAGSEVGAVDADGNVTAGPLKTKSFSGKTSNQALQPRTWRTVH